MVSDNDNDNDNEYQFQCDCGVSALCGMHSHWTTQIGPNSLKRVPTRALDA